MAITITGNKSLMPREFRLGMNQWSRTDGTSGSPTWAGQANLGMVPADQDFGDCIEIVKLDSVTSLRYMGKTPISPGTYLRISTRVKAIAGNIPQVRIAGYAAAADGSNVPGVVQVLSLIHI